METIKILIYTDYEYLFNENPGSPEGGLSDLEKFIEYKTKDLVKVRFTLINRHPVDPATGREENGANKITNELLSDHDEIWVFGRRQINKTKEPNNELELSEVGELEKWMAFPKGGGVFLTGDHSEQDETIAGSSCDEKGHKTFLGLGRALGYRIPRVGQLRGWSGPPTNCIEGELEERDNFNTQEGSDPCFLDSPGLQYDSVPQTLTLSLKECQPHRLFWYTDAEGNARIITKLPDHGHEGKVLAPTDLDSEWPVHSPLPLVAARGRDKRFPNEDRLYNLLVAFDGDTVSVGRIVADSSFHHYLNDNLKNIPDRDPGMGLPRVGSDLDQIAHFFGNLALWLAPKSIRDNIKLNLLMSLARHPDVLEARGNSLFIVGSAARAAARISIGPSNLRWLFGKSKFERHEVVDELLSFIFLEDNFSSLSALLKQEIPLGAIMVACQNLSTAQRVGDLDEIRDYAALWQVIEKALSSILEGHAAALKSILAMRR